MLLYSEQMRVIQRKTDNCQKEPNSTGPESRKGIVAQGLRINGLAKSSAQSPCSQPSPPESLSTPY